MDSEAWDDTRDDPLDDVEAVELKVLDDKDALTGAVDKADGETGDEVLAVGLAVDVVGEEMPALVPTDDRVEELETGGTEEPAPCDGTTGEEALGELCEEVPVIVEEIIGAELWADGDEELITPVEL